MARPTTAQRGREVRSRLMSAACGLIVERGWNAVSTRMLAERAGVTAGLVHYHYASVQALLAEAAIEAIRDHLAQVPQLFERAADPRQALDTLFGELEEHTGLDPASLLFTETYLAATRDDDLRRAVGTLLREFRGHLAGLLERHGIADPDRTAAVLAAGIDGVMLHRALNPGLSGPEVASVLGRALVPGDGTGNHDPSDAQEGKTR